MNLKAKQHHEEDKQKAKASLAARIALLKAQGVDAEQLGKDPHVRKLRADIRKTDSRLLSVAASEKVNSQKLQRRQDKAAGLIPEKPAKEKSAKPAKKEKKVKEKKQASAEQE